MSDAKAEALAKQLKDSLAQRRPRPWKLVLASLAASVLLLALLAWWLYPRAKPAALQVMALDVVCTPDETPNIRAAQLLAPAEDKERRRLSGFSVVFHEPRLLLPPGEQPREIVVRSDERGQSSVEWPLRKPELTDFLVLHVDPEQRKASPQDLGRIFVWPKNAPLLFVDAEETLIATELDPKASATLTTAAKEGWRIVYLALASTTAHDFRKARGWLHENKAKLPTGPVLGPPQFSSDLTSEQARREVLESDARSIRHGPMLAVVKAAESAQICKELGLRTVLVGAGPAPAGIEHAPTWADVPVKAK